MVHVAASAPGISEGGTSSFVIVAAPAPSQPLSVSISISGKAQLGTDYTLDGPADHIVIPAGQTTAILQVHALTDAVKERGETVKLSLNAGNGYKLPKKAGKNATIKIFNVK